MVLNLTIGTLRIPLAVLLGAVGSGLGIVAGHGAAVLAAILIAMVFMLPKCTGSRRLPLAFDPWRLAPMAGFALSNFTSHVLTILVWHLLPLLVIGMAGAEAAGFFYISWAVAGLILLMTQQLALSLFAEGSFDSRGFARQARGALLFGVALSGLFALMVYLFGDLVLYLFGKAYVEESSRVLKLLAAATPLAAVTYIYLGIERVRVGMAPLVTVSAVMAAIMLWVTVVMVPRAGIEGAGYGATAGYGAGALCSILLISRMLISAKTVDTAN